MDQNNAKLSGKIVSMNTIWKSNEHTSYEAMLEVVRDSGTIDLIPTLFNDIAPPINTFISVQGQFRSRDIDVCGKLKVELYIYAQSFDIISDDTCMYDNIIQLEGYVCKKPTIRTTPSGKQISDILVACNFGKDKTAYIPVISWGKCARKSGKLHVGSRVTIYGRLQSRKYNKDVDGVKQEKVAYELSAQSIIEDLTIIDMME